MRAGPLLSGFAAALMLFAGCSAAGPASTPSASGTGHHPSGPATGELPATDRAAVLRATAGAQDVSIARAKGYESSLTTLGCFQDPQQGGMGLHYINQKLLDDRVDGLNPEAMVYELDARGKIAGLVALEYIVPIDAWHATEPPTLFGMQYHRHSTLPLWVLHLWIWKDNANGLFADFNPAVRLCPDGVPVFSRDLPKPQPSTSASSSPSASPSGR